MPKPTLDDVLGLPDALLQDNFNMYFTKAPQIGSADLNAMRLQCMNCVLPGRTLENAPVLVYGYEIRFAGRNTTTHQFQVTYYETKGLSVNRGLDDWAELCRSKRTGHGVPKRLYAGTAVIELLAETGEVAGAIRMFNVFPEVIPEITLDGGATGVIQMACTFTFDEFDWLYKGGA